MEHNFASAGSEKEPLFDLLHPSSPPRMKMDVLPSYDFQPLHPSTCAKVHISSEHSEPAKGRQEQDRQSYNTATVEEVERTMKKYCDNLLHGLERMSGRLTQLESTSQHLESSLLELKMSVRNNHGVTDEKLRLLENLLTEVKTGVQFLKEKQEIAEAYSQLRKLNLSKGGSSIAQAKSTGTPQQVGLTPLHYPVTPISGPTQLPSVSPLPPNAPTPAPSQLNPESILEIPQQLASIPVVPSESSSPPFGQQSAPPAHQYQIPSHMQQLPPHSVLMPPYSMQSPPPQSSGQAVSPPYGQSEHSSHSLAHSIPHPHVPAPLAPNRYGPEPSYMPMDYGGHNHQQPQLTPQPRPRPPFPQHVLGEQQMHESSAARTGSGHFPLGYDSVHAGTNYSESQSYDGPLSKVPHPVPSAPSGGGAYPRLPTAKFVQNTLPMAASVTGPSSASSASGNQVPVDEVIDKVSRMGFSRDQVRSAVQKLTENGHSIDFNTVLDKIMNDGEIQPQKGWFDR